MPRYYVEATALAEMRLRTTIEQETQDAEEVKQYILDHSGDFEWKYEGLQDESIEVSVDKIAEEPVDVPGELSRLETVFEEAVHTLAETVRRTVVLPLCRKYQRTYHRKNGRFGFKPLSEKGGTFFHAPDAEVSGCEGFKDAFEVLDQMVWNQRRLGYYVRDVTKEDLRDKKE